MTIMIRRKKILVMANEVKSSEQSQTQFDQPMKCETGLRVKVEVAATALTQITPNLGFK